MGRGLLQPGFVRGAPLPPASQNHFNHCSQTLPTNTTLVVCSSRAMSAWLRQLCGCCADHTKCSGDSTFRLRQGDVVELMDELQQNALRDDWMYGRCERTGLCGGFPYDSIYILPTCQKPPPDFMVRIQHSMEQTSSISSRSLSVGHLRVLSSIARLRLCS